MWIAVLIVSQADSGDRMASERIGHWPSCLESRNERQRKADAEQTFNSARILDNALQRALVPRFNLIAAMEGGNGR
jgi:hypothetical protein